SMWERGWSFVKKAGTIILLSTIMVWFFSNFGFIGGTFRMLAEEEISFSIMAKIGTAVAWIFAPLGWGDWKAAVATLTGLLGKENIVGTLGVLYGGGDMSKYEAIGAAYSRLAGYSFLAFNLLCAPCFGAIAAIRREMNSAKWTVFAIGWQCGFAYVISLMIYQFGSIFTGHTNIAGIVVSSIFLILIIVQLVRKPAK
ncbi:MAG: ferrous iron transporter B, partial [Lachnospiraceae bacterium]|nr:ferrous iron transporter B [Lachnospiraceae bacterium]